MDAVWLESICRKGPEAPGGQKVMSQMCVIAASKANHIPKRCHQVRVGDYPPLCSTVSSFGVPSAQQISSNWRQNHRNGPGLEHIMYTGKQSKMDLLEEGKVKSRSDFCLQLTNGVLQRRWSQKLLRDAQQKDKKQLCLLGNSSCKS